MSNPPGPSPRKGSTLFWIIGGSVLAVILMLGIGGFVWSQVGREETTADDIQFPPTLGGMELLDEPASWAAFSVTANYQSEDLQRSVMATVHFGDIYDDARDFMEMTGGGRFVEVDGGYCGGGSRGCASDAGSFVVYVIPVVGAKDYPSTMLWVRELAAAI